MGGDERLLKWEPVCTPPTADTETDYVRALTKGSFVLSEIPSPKGAWGMHTVLSVVGGVQQAVSVVRHMLWVSRQDSQVRSKQTVS